jgi:hypothetical protein
MSDVLEIREFFAEGRNQGKSHVLLHITEPSTPKELERGYFFALAEIKNGRIEQIEQIQQMIDDLETGYYSEEGGENSFELTLEYLNRRGHHLLQHENSTIDCLVGTMNGGKITFAHHGQPTALVIYQTKERYESISIIDNNHETDHSPSLFSELMQGKIQKGDYFYIATPNVEQYLSPDRVQKIITSRPAKESAQHIQKVLTDIRSELSFGGVIFHLFPQAEIPKTGKLPFYLKRGSADSLSHMVNAQQNTDETLHPPLWGQAGKTLKKYFGDKEILSNETRTNPEKKCESNYRLRPKTVQKNRLLNMILAGLSQALIMLGKIIYFILSSCVILIKNFFISAFIIISNKGGQRRQIIGQINQSIKRRRYALANLPLLSKILLGATVAFAFIFIGSIIFLKIKTANEAAARDYANHIQAIIDKKNAADASLIYNDEGRAFTLLKEAKDAIAQLPTKTKTQKTKIQELITDVETSLTKIRKIITVEPELLADITKTRAEAKTIRLASIGNNLMAYGEGDNHLYVVDKNTGVVTDKPHEAIPALLNASTPKENDWTIFLTGANSIAQLDKDNFTLSRRDISFPGDNADLTSLFVYDRKIYTLDAKNGQIYRHRAIQSGYERGTPWLKNSTTELTDGVSLAIDGDIYVLKQNGEIAKFTNGEKQTFSLKGIDPVLAQPTELWTYSDLAEIYILEPTNKRVVVINKEGKLIRQITASVWKQPTGMAVDDEAKRVYVLDDNKIYYFPLSN